MQNAKLHKIQVSGKSQVPHTPKLQNYASPAHYPLSIQRKASCSCGGGCPVCQTKASNLEVSQPNDPAEIEADQIADRVMRMPIGRENRSGNEQNKALPTQNAGAQNSIHRKCDTCEDDDEVSDTLLRKEAFASAAPTPPPAGDFPPSIRNVINSGGRPLDRQTLSFFEPRFGTDLGHVRVHTGPTAGQSAKLIKARAYTLGNNIVFGSDEFKPESARGKRLLAHELAHIGQSNNIIHRSMEGYVVAMNQEPESDFGEAAKNLNSEPEKDIRFILNNNLKGADTTKANLYKGGRDEPGVGPCSSICRLTEQFHLKIVPSATPFDYSVCVSAPAPQTAPQKEPVSKTAVAPAPIPQESEVCCDRPELARRVDICIEDARQAAIDCTLATLRPPYDPISNFRKMMEYYICLDQLNADLLECDRRAKRDTNCPDVNTPPDCTGEQSPPIDKFFHGSTWRIVQSIPGHVRPIGGGDFGQGFYTHHDGDPDRAAERARWEGCRLCQKMSPSERYAGVVRFDVPTARYRSLFTRRRTFGLTSTTQPDYAARQTDWLNFVSGPGRGRSDSPSFDAAHMSWRHQRIDPPPDQGFLLIEGPMYKGVAGLPGSSVPPRSAFDPYAEGTALPQQVVWNQQPAMDVLNAATTTLKQYDAAHNCAPVDPPVSVPPLSGSVTEDPNALEEAQIEMTGQ